MTGGLAAPAWYAGQSEEGVWPQVAWSCWSGQQDLKQKEQFHTRTKQRKLSYYPDAFISNHTTTADSWDRRKRIFYPPFYPHFSLKKNKSRIGNEKKKDWRQDFWIKWWKDHCVLYNQWTDLLLFVCVCVSYWPGTRMTPALGCFISRIRLLCFT